MCARVYRARDLTLPTVHRCTVGKCLATQHNLLVGVPGGEGLAVDVHHGFLSEKENGLKYISIVCSTINFSEPELK